MRLWDNAQNIDIDVRYCVLRSALNRVLIPAQECRGQMVQNRTGIMDLQNKNNIWWQNNEKHKFGPNVRYCVLRSALDRVVIPAQGCRGKMVQNRTGIMDLQNKNNMLVAKQ